MRSLVPLLLLAILSLPAAAQDGASPSKDDDSDARASEMSSSKDTRIDLTPPDNDQKAHPNSGVAITDAEGESASDVQKLHPWDPHKAAKDLEVGDFYFKKKNYRAALDRYKEALIYKPNDAVAQFRLAECFDKTGNSGEAVNHYQEYLKILPHGPFSADAQKALDKLKAGTTSDRSAK